MNEIEITLKYENRKSFEMTRKLNSDAAVSIIKVEENGCLAELFDHAAEYCMKQFNHDIATISGEMKKE